MKKEKGKNPSIPALPSCSRAKRYGRRLEARTVHGTVDSPQAVEATRPFLRRGHLRRLPHAWRQTGPPSASWVCSAVCGVQSRVLRGHSGAYAATMGTPCIDFREPAVPGVPATRPSESRGNLDPYRIRPGTERYREKIPGSRY